MKTMSIAYSLSYARGNHDRSSEVAAPVLSLFKYRLGGKAAMIRATVFFAFLCCTLQVEARGQSTAEDRAALLDYILAKTMEREAFSPAKNHALAFDVEEAMLRHRDEFIAADTPQKLYYALARLSNARKDRHLSLAFVDGGIALSDTTGADQGNYPVPGSPIPHAPIRFAADYGTPGQYFVFVSDVAKDIARHTTRWSTNSGMTSLIRRLPNVVLNGFGESRRTAYAPSEPPRLRVASITTA